MERNKFSIILKHIYSTLKSYLNWLNHPHKVCFRQGSHRSQRSNPVEQPSIWFSLEKNIFIFSKFWNLYMDMDKPNARFYQNFMVTEPEPEPKQCDIARWDLALSHFYADSNIYHYYSVRAWRWLDYTYFYLSNNWSWFIIFTENATSILGRRNSTR